MKLTKPEDSAAKAIRFGVELETVIPTTSGVEIGGYHHGRPVVNGLVGHCLIDAPQFGNARWRAERDGSIRYDANYAPCEFVSPILHDPDLLMIDPMLSFVGGNVKEQEVVGNFLRASLNPVIFEHECGMIGYHHTNKPPTGKEKQAWANGELAYLGSGSAEWANWARAVLSLQSLGKAGYYKLHAAKRGARLGWTDGEGQLLYERYIAWSRDGSIYWREPTMEEIAMLEGSGQEDDKLQKKADKIPARFINLLKQRSLTRAEWAKRAKSELGYSNGNAYRYIKDLELAGRVFLSVATSRYSIVIEQTEAAEEPAPAATEETTTTTPEMI